MRFSSARSRPSAPLSRAREPPAAVRRKQAPTSRYPALWPVGDAPRTLSRALRFTRGDRGRCSSPTSATDSSTRAPASLDRARPDAPCRLRGLARPVEANLAGVCSGRGALDGAPPSFERSSRRVGRADPLSRVRAAALRASSAPFGDPIVSPRATPPVVRRCLPRAGRALLSLTPWLRRACAEARTRRPRPPPAPPRQRRHIERPPEPAKQGSGGLGAEPPSSPGAFHRRMPARPGACAPHLERGPATSRRLRRRSRGFRRSFARSPFWGERARPRRYRGLITHGRSWPRAVRRLLPSIRSASTTIGPSIPGASAPRPPACTGRGELAPVRGWFPLHPRVSEAAPGTAEPSCPGSGALS